MLPKKDSDMIRVNGAKIKCPSEYNVTLNDVSAPDSGRDETADMQKGFVARKSTVQLSWNAPTPEEAYDIIHAFSDNEYFEVTYYDPFYCRHASDRRTATFYRGDVESPIWWFYPGRERFSKISFNIVEK